MNSINDKCDLNDIYQTLQSKTAKHKFLSKAHKTFTKIPYAEITKQDSTFQRMKSVTKKKTKTKNQN